MLQKKSPAASLFCHHAPVRCTQSWGCWDVQLCVSGPVNFSNTFANADSIQKMSLYPNEGLSRQLGHMHQPPTRAILSGRRKCKSKRRFFGPREDDEDSLARSAGRWAGDAFFFVNRMALFVLFRAIPFYKKKSCIHGVLNEVYL